MTLHAVRHICKFERRSDFAHRLDLAVAFLTWNVLQNMRLVIEIDKIGKDVHFRPANRLLFIPRFADLLDLRLRRGDQLMTSDASLHRWDHRSFSPTRPAVTVLAAHLILAGVDLMAEGYRLARLQFMLLASDRSEEGHPHDRNTHPYTIK